MKTITYAVSAFCLMCVALSSCKKYEDGPLIQLTSRTDRVTNNWEIDQARSDGNDVSDDFDNYTLFIRDDGTCTLEASYTFVGVTYTTSTDGFWYFRDGDENLGFDFDDDDFDDEFEILRLTDDELWLRDLDEPLELRLEEV